jgi:hypothetical protein
MMACPGEFDKGTIWNKVLGVGPTLATPSAQSHDQNMSLVSPDLFTVLLVLLCC